jgi:hypothetical protein
MKDPRHSFVDSVGGATVHELLRSTRIQIVIGRTDLERFAAQVLLYTLATTTFRLFDNVEVVGDDTVPSHPSLSLLAGPFIAELKRHLQRLRPAKYTAGTEGRTLTVVVGSFQVATGDIFIGSTGWSALVSKQKNQPIHEGMNPLGSLAAGSMGAAEIFKTLFRGDISGAAYADDYCLSLLRYRSSPDLEPLLPEQIAVELVLYGAGSIGCGFLLASLLTPQLQGTIDIVDNGRFEERNTYKYPLLNLEAAKDEHFKATWAQSVLHREIGTRLKAIGHVTTVNGYLASLAIDYKIPIAVCALDNFEARLEVQDTLPEYIVNAGIDGTLAEVSVHKFGAGAACLACLCLKKELESWNAVKMAELTGLDPKRVHRLVRENQQLSLADIDILRGKFPNVEDIDSYLNQPLLSFWNRVGYAETSVSQSGRKGTVTTAFVPTFAGTLQLAEVIKRSVPALREYAVNNSYQQQMLGVPAENTFEYPRDSEEICICHSDFRKALYSDKYQPSVSKGTDARNFVPSSFDPN